MAGNSEVWGHLLCTTETKSPIRLKKKMVTIGRKSSCDISFVTNQLISSNHCLISQDEDGKIWLRDTSTNGTIINGRLVKGEKLQINHNDQIQLIRRKNKPEEDVSYIFQDLKSLKEEFDQLDSTQEYNIEDVSTTSVDGDEEVNIACKRSLSEVSDKDEPASKKSKQDIEEDAEKKCSIDNKKETSRDTMGEALVCGICQDIFHDCLSLQPCMHSFCSSCYSQWMEKSNECPTCRLPVERMSRNHIVNNLVEAYLVDNPEKRRPTEELAEMDARNKITKDMIQPRKKKRNEFVEYGSDVDTDESQDDVSDESDYDDNSFNMGSLNILAPGITSSFTSLFGFTPRNNRIRPATTVCRWCPGFQPSTVASVTPLTSTTASSQETHDSQPSASVPQPVCPSGMTHVMCVCCMKPMPKQENLPELQSGRQYAKSQKCGVCSNFYCHLLWKCNRLGCRGCLNEFEDLDFEVTCLDNIIMSNKYESQILKNYLSEKGWSIKDLLKKCLEKLDSKEYTTLDCVNKPELSSKYILCYHCGLKNFKELVYQFRRDIPEEELPASVTSRPDCHWGKNCRTQINPVRPHHASRFNHICEQTRFR